MNNFEKLSKMNVNEFTEKKGRFTYLSWAHAVAELLKLDPEANWQYNKPETFPDGTMMVFCTVTAFGKSMTSMLPVLNNSNKPIQNPNSMDINTAMQRCLVKAIALHGLGLYLYQGEDLPYEEPVDLSEVLDYWLDEIQFSENMEQLRNAYESAYKVLQKDKNAVKKLADAKDAKKEELL